FAPYFVAGAIFSGTAMVISLTVPMRKILKLENYITAVHYEKLAKVLLVTALIVSYSYIVELCLALYSGNLFEISVFKYRVGGHYRLLYWVMITCNVFMPLALFIKKIRANIKTLFVLSIFINIGMWLERFIIIVTSLAREYDPYSWGTYAPRLVEIAITIGSFGMFFMFFLIFVKMLPVLSISEIKEQGEAANEK
ncbi:MAG TPA: NrfD/PsrC family molybdoenzyme membrane anchor subunit, partial [Candidatus Deferrimicrobium sp.]|nr:NrfD/PsrC family molybdoenzyme membrane anchor subunit [Candidatus Deferrimicrobium sp.]